MLKNGFYGMLLAGIGISVTAFSLPFIRQNRFYLFVMGLTLVPFVVAMTPWFQRVCIQKPSSTYYASYPVNITALHKGLVTSFFVGYFLVICMIAWLMTMVKMFSFSL